jgi:hypothetical protein
VVTIFWYAWCRKAGDGGSGSNGQAGHFKSSAAVGEAKRAKPLLYVCPLTHRSRGYLANGRRRRCPPISPSALQATMASHHVPPPCTAHAPCTMQHGFLQPLCSCQRRLEGRHRECAVQDALTWRFCAVGSALADRRPLTAPAPTRCPGPPGCAARHLPKSGINVIVACRACSTTGRLDYAA